MRAYALLLLKTCHKRGAPAIGGMSALIPIKNDPEKNAIAMPASSATSARRHRRLRRRLGGSPGPGRAGHEGVREGAGRQAQPVRKQRPDVEVKGPTC
jgi:malate synthase